jgi:hypothetical protein
MTIIKTTSTEKTTTERPADPESLPVQSHLPVRILERRAKMAAIKQPKIRQMTTLN